MLVVRLKDIPEDKRKEYIELLDKSLPPPYAEFDENNLRYSVEHLETMGGSIVMLPLEYAAKYVDGIFKQQVDENENEFLIAASAIKHGQILKSDNEFSHMNCTAVGNLAYAVLNALDPEISAIFMEFYSAYADWYAQAVERITEADLEKLAERSGINKEDCLKYFKQWLNTLKKFKGE